MSAARLLVVDDDRTFRLSTAALLRQDGHDVAEAEDGQAALERLRGERFDLILLDQCMPGQNGVGLVEVLRTWEHDTPILMISGLRTVDTAVTALHTGADDFLTKPVEPDVLSARVESLLSRGPLPPDERERPPGGLIGRSPAIRSVLEAVRRVGPTDATVLVTGETGTGKELVARAIHGESERSGGPFVAVNCAALEKGLLESELFGHRKGAFAGAVLEAASGGTILLDEIGDVSSATQHRLLRVLREREIMPVGAVRPVPVDVRVVAATNRELKAETEAGRDDHYYRLHVVRIELPPLRARREDIPLFAETFYEWAGRRRHEGCSPLAMRLMQAYSWPGNLRQLLAVLESAHIRAGERRIEAQHLPAYIRGGDDWNDRTSQRYRREVPEHDERVQIEAALAATGGVRSAASHRSEMSRTTLWRRMRELGLDG